MIPSKQTGELGLPARAAFVVDRVADGPRGGGGHAVTHLSDRCSFSLFLSAILQAIEIAMGLFDCEKRRFAIAYTDSVVADDDFQPGLFRSLDGGFHAAVIKN